MQCILDAPVAAHGLQHLSRRGLQAADVITGVDRSAFRRLPAGAYFDRRLQPGPLRLGSQVVQAVRVSNNPAFPPFDASVALVLGPGVVMGDSLEAVLFRHLEKLPEVILQPTLVVLYLQHIVSPAFHNLLRYLPLTPHGIDGHDAPLERQEFQQLGNGGDFVGLLLGPDLAQGHGVG